MGDMDAMLGEIRTLVINRLEAAQAKQAEAHREEIDSLQQEIERLKGDAAKQAKAHREEIERLKGDAAKQAEAHHGEVNRLVQEIDRLRTDSYIKTFDSGSRWILLAIMRLELSDAPHWWGIAEGLDGGIVPFLTMQNADAINVGNEFTAQRDELVPTELPTSGAAELEQVAAPARTPMTGSPETGDDSTLFDSTVSGTAEQEKVEPLVQPAEAHEPEDSEATVFYDHAVAEPETPSDPTEGLPFLEVTAGIHEGQRFHLDFTVSTVGRSSENTIVLADSAASIFHAEIRFDGTNFRLRDKDSTNGTYYQGKPITEVTLQLGDTVRVGETEMTFTCEGSELMTIDPARGIDALRVTLKRQPDFVPALRTLAFLLERDVAHKKEAKAVWDRLARLEGRV
jgi:hypothetical protein